jgi:hypothetical protein
MLAIAVIMPICFLLIAIYAACRIRQLERAQVANRLGTVAEMKELETTFVLSGWVARDKIAKRILREHLARVAR